MAAMELAGDVLVVKCTFSLLDLRDLCESVVLLLADDGVGDWLLLADLLLARLPLLLRCRAFRTFFFFVSFNPSFCSSRSARAAFISAILFGSSAPPPFAKHFSLVCPIRPQFSHFGSVRVCSTTALSMPAVGTSVADVAGVDITLAVCDVAAVPLSWICVSKKVYSSFWAPA